jgi:EAL domain-containing protein (putative c-di-GMP-specific phosphodiesterase class I)
MYLAKDLGRNNCQFYAPEMSAKAVERLLMQSALRRALEAKQFELHYQPQISLARGEVIGMEALVRWRDPEKGLISPMKFIPVAEETGLIIPLGEWVLEQACAQAKAWQNAGLPPLRVSVNLSAAQLRQRHFSDVVRRILEDTGLAPQYLDLELTESMVMGETLAMIKRLNEFRALGINLSIDDFGTGYSSLAYLKAFPLEQLKIDRSFVSDLPGSNDAAAIVKAIVSLAHSLRLSTVAEGVETLEQARLLRAIGCEYGQGYFYSKPIPAVEFEAFIRSYRPLALIDPARPELSAAG